MDQLTKTTKILKDLKQAYQRLVEATKAEPTDLHQDATIQRFEFNFELSWKLMKTTIEYQGETCASPRFCIRKAANMEIINNPEDWIDFLNERNILTHTYKLEHARKLYKKIVKKFPELVNQLITNVERTFKE